MLCILAPVCLTGVSAGRTLDVSGAVAVRSLDAGGCDSVSAGRTFGPVELRGWSSGRTLGAGGLSSGAGACLGVGPDVAGGGDGSEDTGPVSGVAGVCCSGVSGAWVSGSFG